MVRCTLYEGGRIGDSGEFDGVGEVGGDREYLMQSNFGSRTT